MCPWSWLRARTVKSTGSSALNTELTTTLSNRSTCAKRCCESRTSSGVMQGPSSLPRTPGRPRVPAFAFDHCVLDLVKRELRSSDGDLIDLTDAEIRLLTLFVQNPARVLSRDEIARHIQGHDWSPLDRTVDGHVARLRRKLEGAAVSLR